MRVSGVHSHSLGIDVLSGCMRVHESFEQLVLLQRVGWAEGYCVRDQHRLYIQPDIGCAAFRGRRGRGVHVLKVQFKVGEVVMRRVV